MSENFNLEALKESNGSDGAGGGSGAVIPDNETPEQKAEREKNAGGGGGNETPEQKAEREKKELELKNETPEQKVEREKKELELKNETPEQKTEREKKELELKNETPEQKAEREKKELELKNETPEQKVEREKTEKATADDKIKNEAQAELFKKLGVKDMTELQEKLKGTQEESPEQKKDREERYTANLHQYAVTNKVMSLGEIKALTIMEKQTDEELARQAFGEKFKKTKADATAEDIDTEFKLFYHTEATVDTLKKAGAEDIKAIADGMRAALTNKLAKAKEAFDDTSNRKTHIPAYKQLIQQSLKDNVPESLELLSPKDSEKVFLKIDPKIKEDIEKFLVNEETFDTFLAHGGSQQTTDMLKARTDAYLRSKLQTEIYSAIYEAGKSAGGKNGSGTGATASFTNNQGAGDKKVEVNADDDLKPEEKDKLAGLFGGNR